jgi:hypothetical protein
MEDRAKLQPSFAFAAKAVKPVTQIDSAVSQRVWSAELTDVQKHLERDPIRLGSIVLIKPAVERTG